MDNLFQIFKIEERDVIHVAELKTDLHFHDFEELIICIEGELEHFIDFKTTYIKAHSASALKDGRPANKSIEFEFGNHDNVFDIIAKIQEKNIFGDKEQDIEFALGIKLFSEIMLRHKEHPLFEELKPVFGRFMKKLKEQV